MATDQEAVDVVDKGGKDALTKAKKLIQHSIEQKSGDNLTAAVIML